MMKKKIVIVEDNRLLATVLKKMAMSLEFDVLAIAKTGKDAVETIKKHQPDLIFMDIFLADDLTGIDVMKQVREFCDAPVIYITAQSDFQVRKDASSVENSLFMLKPVNMDELKTAVDGSLSTPAA